MPPGRGSLSDEVLKNTQRKYEWLKGVSLEHVGTSFINVEYERKKKLLLRIFDKLCVSLFIPLLCAHLYEFVMVGGHKNFITLFGVHIDTKII
jgi:hypothetical protein